MDKLDKKDKQKELKEKRNKFLKDSKEQVDKEKDLMKEYLKTYGVFLDEQDLNRFMEVKLAVTRSAIIEYQNEMEKLKK